MDWDYIWNGFWTVIIIITTVGYGDYYPTTLLGKIVAVFACMVGPFLISTTTFAISTTIGLSNLEERVNCGTN